VSGPLWAPGAERVRRANLTAFIQRVRDRRPEGAEAVFDFPSLYRWSVERPEAFWPEVWSYCGVVAEERPEGPHWDRVAVGLDRMAPPDPELGPRWFPGARLNYGEHILRHERAGAAALLYLSEDQALTELSWESYAGQVRTVATRLRELGVRPRQRVVGYLPNIPEAMVAMVATASIGAVWAGCAPEIGWRGASDRLGQLEPAVLFTVDGYRYGGVTYDRREEVRLQAAKPTAQRHAVLRRRAANAPSVPWRCGSTRSRPASSTVAGTAPSGGGSSRQFLFSVRKRSTCVSFSSVSSEHVLYTRRPPGFTMADAERRISRCTAPMTARSEVLRRHRASGCRRNVPVPVQGTSMSTASAARITGNRASPATT
jgi:hypothetical protein